MRVDPRFDKSRLSKRTRRCLETAGWLTSRASTISFTGRSWSRRRSRMSLRLGSTITSNAVTDRVCLNSYITVKVFSEIEGFRRLLPVRRQASLMVDFARMRTRPVLKMSACLAVAILFGACGSSPSGSARPTNETTTTSSTATTAQSTGPSTATSFAHVTGPSVAKIDSSTTVTIGSKTVKVPTDSGKPITAEDGDGQQIIISAAGFLPLKLYSTPSVPIVWTNLTDQDQKVAFDYFSVISPVIPPGGTFSWKTEDSESIAYHSYSGMHAVVVVNPPGI